MRHLFRKIEGNILWYSAIQRPVSCENILYKQKLDGFFSVSRLHMARLHEHTHTHI